MHTRSFSLSHSGWNITVRVNRQQSYSELIALERLYQQILGYLTSSEMLDPSHTHKQETDSLDAQQIEEEILNKSNREKQREMVNPFVRGQNRKSELSHFNKTLRVPIHVSSGMKIRRNSKRERERERVFKMQVK